MAHGASLSSLEDWLIAICEHTRETKEAVQRGAGKGGTAAGGGTPAAVREWPQHLDDLIEKMGKRIEGALSRGIGWGQGQVQSLRGRGMSGTLEAARLDYGMEQLGKQVAAIFLPVTQATGYLVSNIERRLRGLNGDGQDRAMGAVLGGGLGFRFGGPMGALAGAALGSAFMGSGSSTRDGLVGALGGAAIGFRSGGVPGAVVGAGVGYVAGRGDYGELRKKGYSRGASAVGSVFAGGGDYADAMLGYFPASAPFYWGARATGWRGYGDEARAKVGIDAESLARANAPPSGRRDVTPFSAEMTNAGDQHFAMQASMIRATAGPDFSDGGPFQPFMDMLIRILDELMKIANPGYEPPAPRSSETAR